MKSLGINAGVEGEHLTATVAAGQIEPERIVSVLVELGVGIKSFSLAAPTLEERFVGLTGEGFDVAR